MKPSLARMYLTRCSSGSPTGADSKRTEQRRYSQVRGLRLDYALQAAERWISLTRQYSEITELDAPLLNTVTENIVVREETKGAEGVREQEVEIYYRFVGKIDA